MFSFNLLLNSKVSPISAICVFCVCCSLAWMCFLFPSPSFSLIAQSIIVAVYSLSRVWLFETPWTEACQAPHPSLSPQACSNSSPLIRWCHSTISSPVAPFSSCPQSFPASESFPLSRLFTSGGLSIGSSALASVLPMNIQGWIPLGSTGLIYLLSRDLYWWEPCNFYW